MDRETEKFIKELFRDHARKVVGRLCRQNELVQERTDLSSNQKLSLLKSFNKELVYEETRDLENNLKAYSKGIELINYKIYKPTTE